jgi:hypothetical protein
MYKLIKKPEFATGLDVVHRLSDNAFIPFDEQNTDYQAFLLWCSEGNTPLPADEPVAE